MSLALTRFKVLAAVAGSYVATVINAGTAYLSMLVLGPERLGMYQSLLLIKNYALYANLGEVQAVRKQGAVLSARGATAELERYLAETLTLALITSAVVVAALLVAERIGLHSEGARALTFYVVLVLFVLEYLQYFLGNQLAAFNRFEEWSRGAVLLSLVSMASLLLVIPFGYAGFLFGKALAGLVFLFYLALVLRYRIRLAMPTTWLSLILGTGVPMAVVGLMTTVLTSADRLAVIVMRGDYEVGLYSLATMLGMPLMLFVQGLVTVLFTRSSHLMGAQGEAREIVHDTMAFAEGTARSLPALVLMLVLCLPAAITLALPRYEPGVTAAQLAMLGLTFYAIASPLANLYLVLNNPSRLVGILCIGSAASFAFGVVALRLGGGLELVGAGSMLALAAYAFLVTYGALRLGGDAPRSAAGRTARMLRRQGAFTLVAAPVLLLVQHRPERAWIGVGLAVALAVHERSRLATMVTSVRRALRRPVPADPTVQP